MVRDKKIALAAFAQPTFPQAKYPNLFLLFLVPAVGHSVEENEKAAYEILERLKKEKVDQATLDRVKTKLRASLIRQLDSNSGLAQELTQYYAGYGDWRKLFTGLEEINAVTADDVQRVAREYLVERTRTVAYTVKPKAEAGEEAK
jgi:predicted Zn-dependent peptidase